MKVSFLQWNIWYDEDIRNIAKYLLENKADIICLQELSLNGPKQLHTDGPQYIAKQLGYNYYTRELQEYEEDGQTYITANGIFTKFPITSSRFVWINEPVGSGGFDDEYRAYLESELIINDFTLTVGTVHMSYTHGFEVSQRKREETDRLVTELAKRKKNFIFSGDLNAQPDSYVVKSIESVLQHSGPAYDQKTWTTKPFSYNGFEETELNWRLDYVLATPDINIKSATIDKTDYSDHLPVRAEFEL